MLPIKNDDPSESLVDETAIWNEISWKKGCATGFVLHINMILRTDQVTEFLD